MIAPVNFIRGTMPRFSTDPIALSVNCFIARRATLASRPDSGEEQGVSRAATPLEVLYPSLYAGRGVRPARWRGYVRAAAALFALMILGGR
jgi:hypothetical protein